MPLTTNNPVTKAGPRPAGPALAPEPQGRKPADLTLPKNYNLPFHAQQFQADAGVSLDVAAELVGPVGGGVSGRRGVGTARMALPKAAVDENGDAARRPDNVGATGQALRSDAVAEVGRPECPADDHFGSGVAGRNGPHDAGLGSCIKEVGHAELLLKGDAKGFHGAWERRSAGPAFAGAAVGAMVGYFSSGGLPGALTGGWFGAAGMLDFTRGGFGWRMTVVGIALAGLTVGSGWTPAGPFGSISIGSLQNAILGLAAGIVPAVLADGIRRLGAFRRRPGRAPGGFGGTDFVVFGIGGLCLGAEVTLWSLFGASLASAFLGIAKSRGGTVPERADAEAPTAGLFACCALCWQLWFSSGS